MSRIAFCGPLHWHASVSVCVRARMLAEIFLLVMGQEKQMQAFGPEFSSSHLCEECQLA